MRAFRIRLLLVILAEITVAGIIGLTSFSVPVIATSTLAVLHAYLLIVAVSNKHRPITDTFILLLSPIPAYTALTHVPDNLATAIVLPASGVIATVISWTLIQRINPKNHIRFSEVLILGVCLAMGYGIAPAPRIVYGHAMAVMDNTWAPESPASIGSASMPKKVAGQAGLQLTNDKFKGDSTVQMYVRIDSAAGSIPMLPLYLREKVYESLHGNRWQETKAPSIHLDTHDGISDGWTNIDPHGNRNISDHTSDVRYTVYDPSSTRRNLCAMPRLRLIRLPGIINTGSSLQFYQRPEGPIRYELESRTVRFKNIRHEVLTPGPGSAAQTELPLNSELQDAARAIALQIAPKNENPPVGLVVEKLIALFANAYTYDESNAHLDTTLPLLDFMVNSRKGNCTMYASATTLVLRSLGYPARVAVGYTSNTYHPKPDAFVVRSRDAHAWPEVNLTGYGWVIVDPLNGPARSNPPADANPELADFDEDAFSDLGKNAQEAPPLEPDAALKAPLDMTPANNVPIRQSTAFSLAILLVFLPFVLLRFLRRTRLTKEENEYTAGAHTFLQNVLKHLARSGISRRKSETFREYVDQLKERDLASEELESVVQYYYDVRYRAQPRNQQTEDAILLKLTDWSPPENPK